MTLYEERMKLAALCASMQDQGLKIDPVYAQDLAANFDSYRALLFPSEKVGRRRVFRYFNPTRNAKAIVKWFKDAGIELRSILRADVEDAWNALADECDWTAETPEASLPESARALRRLYWYKTFNRTALNFLHARFIDRSNFIHPRWHPIGNPIGSITCSKPPLPPADYMGGLVRRAVVPLPGHHSLSRVTVDIEGAAYGRTLSREERLLTHGVGFAFLTEREVDERLKKEGPELLHVEWSWRVAGRIICFNSYPLATRLYGRRTKRAREAALKRVVPFFQGIDVSMTEQILGKDYVEWDDHFLRLSGNTLEDRFQAACSFLYGVQTTHQVHKVLMAVPLVPCIVDGAQIIYSGPFPELDNPHVKVDNVERWG